jgi:hypothetical protein
MALLKANTGIGITNPSVALHVLGDGIFVGVVSATTFYGNIGGGVQGSLPYQSTVNSTAFLSPGTAGQVLITNGLGQNPYWADVSGASGSFSGITISDEGVTPLGTASSITSINFVGPNVVATASGAGATITLSNDAQYLTGTAPGSVISQSSGLTVTGNVNISGSLSVGGTSVILNAATLQVKDRDIVLGITTNALNQDVSTDLTATHGGIAIASTEGSPILNFPIEVGINSNPSTYKQLMWIKAGTYSGMSTDAWVSNYALSIGNTSTVAYGSRLTVGTGFTVYDNLVYAPNIYSTGVVTATQFVGSLIGNVTSADYAVRSGIATNVIGGIGSITQLQVTGVSTFTNGPVLIGSGTSTGTASQALQVTGGAYVSGRFGIGTTNPDTSTLLDVRGNIFATKITFSNSTPTQFTQVISPAGNTGLDITCYGNYVGGFYAVDQPQGIQLQSGSSLYWTNSTSTQNSGDLFILRDSSNVLAQRNAGVGQTFRIYNTYTSSTNFERAQIGWTTNTFIVGTEKGSAGGSARNLYLQTDGTTRVAINTTGEVGIGTTVLTGTASQRLQVIGGAYVSGNTGIGTTNPTSKLYVVGDGFFTGVVTSTGFKGDGSGLTNLNFGSIAGAISGITILDEGTTVGTASSINSLNFVGGNVVATASGVGATITIASNLVGTALSISGISTFTNGPVLIGTATSTGTASQRLQVTGGAYVSGNTGIGTTNPLQPLQVGFGTNIVVVDNIGELGIGVTNPLQKLHVLGNVLVAAGSATTQHITQRAYELNNGTLSWEASAGQLFSITNNLTSGSIFSVNDVSGIPSIDVDANGTVSMVSYGGSLGIGTINPSQKLHVQGSARISGAFFDSSNSAGTSGQILSSTQTATQWINASSANVGSANSIAINADSTDASRYVTFVSTTSGNNLVYVDSDLLYNPSTNSLVINSTSFTGTASQNLQVTGGAYVSGNLGIGITRPTSKLQVVGDVLVSGVVTATSFIGTATTAINVIGGIGSITQLQVTGVSTFTNGPVFIGAATSTGTASQRLQVTGGGYVSGNVGIGTTLPQYKLHVVGDFGATTKSFSIPHPTKPGLTLRHGSLEGPENGVYVRGKTTESSIPLPDYWTGLVDEESISVNLTPKNGKLHSVVGISSNTVEIECIGGEIDCYFMVLGERKDVAKLDVEY